MWFAAKQAATDDTADVTFALTDPNSVANNTITGGGADKTVNVTLDYTQTDFTITATKTAAQTIAVGGADAAEVDVVDNATAPTYTIDSLSAGNTKTFTLTVSEPDMRDIVYTVNVTVKSSVTTPATQATITFNTSTISQTAQSSDTLTIDIDGTQYTWAFDSDGSQTSAADYLAKLAEKVTGDWSATYDSGANTLTLTKTAAGVTSISSATLTGTLAGSALGSAINGTVVDGADEIP